MATQRLHQLVERLSTLFRSELRSSATTHGLKLVQLEALVFLSMANRYSDTPAAVTEYLGVTKGTASQTIKALENQGFVHKRPDAKDRRVQHCALTPKGRRVASQAFPTRLLDGVAAEQAGAAELVLERVLADLQRANGHRLFGVCRTCEHFVKRKGGSGRCGLTEEPLTKADAQRLCREYSRSDGAAP